MRVALDCTVLDRPGGIAVYARQLVAALGGVPDREPLVLWSASRSAADMLGAALPSKAQVRESSLGPRLGYLLRVPWLNPLSVERLVGPVDVLHGLNYFLPAHRGLARTVVTVHDLSALRYPAWHPWWRALLHRVALPATVARADHVITDTQAVRAEVIERFGIAPDRVTAVPVGVSPLFRPRPAAELKPLLDRYGLRPEGYICYVGGVEPRKNLDRLLDAYALVRARGRDTPPLVVAGFSGWRNDRLRARLEAEAVRDLGVLPHEDVAAVIAGCAVFAYPSLYEGFGLPVLEAMASGVPVVASTDPSILEVAEGAAVLVDPLRPDAIAAALESALPGSALSDRLRRDGPRRAAAFTWNRTAVETLAVYARVVAQPRRRP